jgi:hypothetical protein
MSDYFMLKKSKSIQRAYQKKKIRLYTRGVSNLPGMVKSAGGELEPCNACAFIRIGDQQCKTAVVTGSNSAFWEEEFDLAYETDDEITIDVLHCDRVGSDTSLGTAAISIVELLSANAAELAAGAVVERNIPLHTISSELLFGADGQLAILQLGVTLPANRASYIPPSDSDEELPRSELQDPPDHAICNNAAPPVAAAQPYSPPAVRAEDPAAAAAAAAPSTAAPSPAPQEGRGGVGLRFKVRGPDSRDSDRRNSNNRDSMAVTRIIGPDISFLVRTKDAIPIRMRAHRTRRLFSAVRATGSLRRDGSPRSAPSIRYKRGIADRLHGPARRDGLDSWLGLSARRLFFLSG